MLRNFVHEIGHAYNQIFGLQIPGKTSNGLNWTEEQAMEFENSIGKQTNIWEEAKNYYSPLTHSYISLVGVAKYFVLRNQIKKK